MCKFALLNVLQNDKRIKNAILPDNQTIHTSILCKQQRPLLIRIRIEIFANVAGILCTDHPIEYSHLQNKKMMKNYSKVMIFNLIKQSMDAGSNKFSRLLLF